MAKRPSDLAQRMYNWAEPDDMVRQTLQLPVDAARGKRPRSLERQRHRSWNGYRRDLEWSHYLVG